MFCSSCGTQNEEGTKFCASCGAPLPVAVDPSTVNVPTAVSEKGLGWAKFLGYFALWAGALLNFFGGIRSLTGAQYGSDAALVYSIFKSLKLVDVCYGLACIAIVVVQVIAAISIIKRKKAATILVPTIYLIVFVSVLLYSVIVGGIVHSSVFSTTIITNLTVNIVMAVVNLIYFKNRSNVFCN